MKLQSPTGSIAKVSLELGSSEQLTRPAILVHSGANGEKITFLSADGEISFDNERIERIVKNQNEKLQSLANDYGGIDKMPMGAFLPILDQHEEDSNNRVVGRLTSLLSIERKNVPGVGENVTCATAHITFLGSETVERVKDGRIYHLSIGIDEATDTLEEVSTVIKPAASGAMVLKRGKRNIIEGDKRMNKGKKNSNEKLKKLASIQKNLKTLSSNLVTANDTLRLARAKGEVISNLTNLMRLGKMTPAEYKKIDVKKLAALSSESRAVVLETFNNREPLVLAGQISSTDAVDFGQIGKSLEKEQKKKLKSEIAKDFKRLGKKLAFGDDASIDKDHGEDKEMAGGNEVEPAHLSDPHAVPGQAGDESQLKNMFAKHMEDMHVMRAHLEAGDVGKAKEHHEAMMCHLKDMGCHLGHGMKHLAMGDVKSEDYQEANDNLQAQVDELKTQIARIAGMVDELINVEKEEGEEFAHEAETHKGLSEEEEIKNELKKSLAGEDEKDEKKLESEPEDKEKLKQN